VSPGDTVLLQGTNRKFTVVASDPRDPNRYTIVVNEADCFSFHNNNLVKFVPVFSYTIVYDDGTSRVVLAADAPNDPDLGWRK
jgi:hypothetical protein